MILILLPFYLKIMNKFFLQMAYDSDDEERRRSEDLERLGQDVGFPKRYLLALMVFLGFAVLYALRVNLNVAIGAMCNNHTIYENGFYINKVR